MKVRALRVAFLLVLVLAVVWGAFASWCHVPIEDPVAFEQARAEVNQRLLEVERLPKEQNGFEAGRGLWGFPNDPKGGASDLKEILARPVFACPTRLLPEDPVPNFGAMQAAALSLDSGQLLVNWGCKLARSSTSLLEEGVAVEIADRGCDLLLKQGATSKELAEVDFPADLLARVMDCEMVFALHCMSQIHPGPASYSLGSISSVPFLGNLYLQRERNLYINYTLRQRRFLVNLTPGPDLFLEARQQSWDVAFRSVLLDTRGSVERLQRLRAKLAALKGRG